MADTLAQAETLSSLSVVAYVLAGLLFVCAVVLFIVLKIPEVIDYFTNRSAKRSVQKMRIADGASSKIAAFHTSPTNRARGKLTEPVTAPEPRKVSSVHKKTETDQTGRPETGLLKDSEEAPTVVEITEELVVNPASATELLDQDSTTVLQETVEKVAANRPHIELKKLDEVFLIHTDEVIG